MKKTKFFEWLGFLIVLASIYANGLIRHNGNSDTIWFNVTIVVMAIGAITTFTAFFIRKSKS